MQCYVSWLEATSIYIISMKSKLTCLWLHKEKEKLKMKIVRFKLNGKNCIFFNQVKTKQCVCYVVNHLSRLSCTI